MRIAQVMLARGFGGAERSFFDVTQELTKVGHSVMVVMDPRSVLFSKVKNDKSLLVIPVKCHGFWDVVASYKIKQALENFDAQVVHTHLARSAYLGGKAAKALGIPSLVKTHNLVKLKYYKMIDYFVATTSFQAEYLLSNGVSAKQITIIPNFTRLSPVSVVCPRAEKEPYLIRAVGRLVEKKGFDTLIAALALVRKVPILFQLELGGSGPELENLTQQVKRCKLESEIKFCGWIEDVQSFIGGADLFILPSRDEPFGIVVLESMASGVPIISSRTQGPTEILTDEMADFFESDNAAALAEKIIISLSSSARWDKAQVALEKLKTTYTGEQVVKEYEHLYNKMIQ